MATYLDFEKPVAALRSQIDDLRKAADEQDLDVDAEIARLEGKATAMLRDIYGKLTPWQKTQVARHPDRPHFADLVDGLFKIGRAHV